MSKINKNSRKNIKRMWYSSFFFSSFFFFLFFCLSLQGHRFNGEISRQEQFVSKFFLGWSGGAMVLGKLPVPGRPTV